MRYRQWVAIFAVSNLVCLVMSTVVFSCFDFRTTLHAYLHRLVGMLLVSPPIPPTPPDAEEFDSGPGTGSDASEVMHGRISDYFDNRRKAMQEFYNGLAEYQSQMAAHRHRWARISLELYYGVLALASGSIGTGTALIALGMTARRRRGSIDGLTRCGTCSHILRGLSEPRCPECGTPL